MVDQVQRGLLRAHDPPRQGEREVEEQENVPAGGLGRSRRPGRRQVDDLEVHHVQTLLALAHLEVSRGQAANRFPVAQDLHRDLDRQDPGPLREPLFLAARGRRGDERAENDGEGENETGHRVDPGR